MKRRIFRLLAIITVLAILLFAVPVKGSAFAAGILILSPNSAKVGQSVTHIRVRLGHYHAG